MVSVRPVSSSRRSRRAVTSSSISRRRASQRASLAAFSARAASRSSLNAWISKSSRENRPARDLRKGDQGEDGDVGTLSLLNFWISSSLTTVSGVSSSRGFRSESGRCNFTHSAWSRRHSSSNFWLRSSSIFACSSARQAASRCSFSRFHVKRNEKLFFAQLQNHCTSIAQALQKSWKIILHFEFEFFHKFFSHWISHPMAHWITPVHSFHSASAFVASAPNLAPSCDLIWFDSMSFSCNSCDSILASSESIELLIRETLA